MIPVSLVDEPTYATAQWRGMNPYESVARTSAPRLSASKTPSPSPASIASKRSQFLSACVSGIQRDLGIVSYSVDTTVLDRACHLCQRIRTTESPRAHYSSSAARCNLAFSLGG